jgi:hypothetical protein
MKSTVIFAGLIFSLNFLGLSQIVQPGQLEVVVYPGSTIEGIDKTDKTVSDKAVKLFIYDDFSEGLLCVNKQDCYKDINYNIDVLNRSIALKYNDGIKYLSFGLFYLIQDSSLNKSFTLESFLHNNENENYLVQLLFKSESAIFFKRYKVKELQANYRPEFDIGSKTNTFQIEYEYVFIDENNELFILKKLKYRFLRKYLKNNKFKSKLDESKLNLETEDSIVSFLSEVYN